MRNITKIVLLLIIAFVVYLLWPRTPSLKGFDPAELARLQVLDWQSEKADKGLGAVMTRYKIYTSQYHFAPVSAFRIAQSQGAALEHQKLSREPGAEVEENRALASLTEKYTWIKQQTKGDFNPDALAREEFGWRNLELDENAPPEAATDALARILAGLYGGAAGDFTEVATNLEGARALILKDGAAAADDANPAATAQTAAREAYTLLKEIASVPPAAPAQ